MNNIIKTLSTACLVLLSLQSQAMSCDVNKSVDLSKNGVISQFERQLNLSITCDKELPTAANIFEDVKNFTTICSFEIQSSGRDTNQFPGFELREHSHSNLIATGKLIADVKPLSKCTESLYGNCRSTGLAPELGFTISLRQVGPGGFTGIFMSTNRTQDLSQREFESTTSSLAAIHTSVQNGIETRLEGTHLVKQKIETLSFNKNLSLGNLLREANQSISSGKCQVVL